MLLWILPAFATTSLKSSEWNLRIQGRKWLIKQFLSQKVNIQNCKSLSCCQIDPLSHGQGFVERQFSFIKELLDNNMQMTIFVIQKHNQSHQSELAHTTLHRYQQRSFIVC